MSDAPVLCSSCGCALRARDRRPGLTVCACIVTGRFTAAERIATLEEEVQKLKREATAWDGINDF